MMRLQKYMALCGYCSRRKAEGFISNGVVTVNGDVVKELGFKIEENIDSVEVEGKPIKLESNKIYVLLNKPVGYISTVKDQFSRKTVVDLIEDIEERIYPVGRLDYDTSGLIILTNDGELTNIITHPKHHVNKTYRVSAEGEVTPYKLKLLEQGIDIGGYVTSPAKISNKIYKNGKTNLEITISEGKNRQIRKMFDFIDTPVIELERIMIGKIGIDGLKKGKWRKLTDDEIDYLYGKGR